MPPEDALEFFVPRVHGDTSCPFVLSVSSRLGNGVKPYTGRLGRPLGAPSGNYRQHSLYVGWVTCLFALVSLAALFAGKTMGPCRRDLGFFAVAASVFFLLSLGRFFEPAYRIVFSLPFGDLIRCPVKWHHLTEFALVFMAGCGIEFLLRISEKVKRRVCGINPAVVLLGAIVIWGAVDLAVEDRRYCAPIDVSAARKTGSSVQLAVLSKADFSKPQIAALVQGGQVISIANYLGNPNYYLVGVLNRFEARKKGEISPFAAVFGFLSVLTSVGVLAFSLRAAMRR
jgi:hypothetical protein